MSDAEFRAVVASLGASRPAEADRANPLRTVCVVGSGPVGLALACEALAAGLQTRLWSPVARELAVESVTVRGAQLIGTYRFGVPATTAVPSVVVAPGVDVAVAGADVVLVAVPSLAVCGVAALLAPHLTDGQLLVLVPGRSFGAVEVRRELRRQGCTAELIVAELAAPPYLVSSPGPGRLEIHAVPGRVDIGASAAVAQRLAAVWPSVVAAPGGQLGSTFADLGGVLRVAPVALNAGLAERGGGPWSALVTPTVAAVMEAVDVERREVAFAFGVRDLPSAAAWLADAYAAAGGSLHETWHGIAAFDDLLVGSGGLRQLLADDVACSLVPLAAAGQAALVPTPAADALVATASLLCGVDFATLGRSFGALGLAGADVETIRRSLR